MVSTMARLRYTDYCRHDRDAARLAGPLRLAFLLACLPLLVIT